MTATELRLDRFVSHYREDRGWWLEMCRAIRNPMPQPERYTYSGFWGE